MKTRILLIIFIFSGFAQVNAQDKKFNFGLKVAPAVSWLNSNQTGISSDGISAKFNWGFIGTYNFSQTFSLISGFNVNSLGGKLKDDATNISIKTRYSELQIPALFQMKSNDIAGFKIYFQLGLAQGVFITAKNDDGESIYSQTRPFNTSWIISSGISVPVKGDVNLIGQIKYNGGLTNIAKSGYNKATADFIELGLGVLF